MAVLLPPWLLAQQRPTADNWPSDSVAVHAALNRFLTAFEQLDWPVFRAAFSDSASIFHPAPAMAERVVGPAGIDSTFRRVFAELRAQSPAGPPFQRLMVTDLRIQSLGPELVLVTFHLRNAERLGRRTLIFRAETDQWQIVHLHASNFTPPPQ